MFLSYNYGATLTLGNALKKDFSLISGDSTQRAFPSRDFAVKLAIWLEVRMVLFVCRLGYRMFGR